ncbi:MAG TPA: thioredoxin domain-containing protein [Ktedonobacterales bacterium]|jgi:hypothetical protein
MSHINDDETPQYTNRLIHETSPYLLQHAHNPVDWYPWGKDALTKAQSEDKPIFLSIGYSACHWCHRLREESFEDEDTARMMNELYVSIKVDREERPDLDALYMEAVQALTGSGGWPMTVFLTPDGAPFYGGTYFPPRDRYGMPSFTRVLRGVTDLYRNQREEVERQAQAFREHYAGQTQTGLKLPNDFNPATATISAEVLTAAANALVSQFDAVEGGFGPAPKFPHPMGLEFLLRVEARRRAKDASALPSSQLDENLLPLMLLTLDKMADGGIYDQVGGGFHRYSTDKIWLTPHFEKMLYDNALLAPAYLHAWQLTGETRYRRIAEETLDYVLREMSDPSGAFYSTQDADSEGEEGKFYVWSAQEMHDLLSDDAKAALAYWGVTDGGNFEGKNILHVAQPLEDVAASLGISTDEALANIERARKTLYEARSRRVWPGKDDKALAAWNGWMLRAFAEAGRLLDREDYRAAANRNADFVARELLVDGRLRRAWRNGQAKLDAYLEDYASLANAFLSLYEATGDASRFTFARVLVETMIARFWDEPTGAFFDTASDAEALIGRPRDLTDNATPSGTSLACEALLRLTAFTGNLRYREYAARILVALAPAMERHPSSFGHLLCALDDLIGPYYEVAIVGNPADTVTQALVAAINSRFLPRMALAVGAPGDTEVPLLENRALLDGRPAAYVCQGFVCQRPVTASADLLSQLGV